MKVQFPNISGVILGFFFQVLLISLKEDLCFLVPQIKMWLFQWYRSVYFQVGWFGTLEYSRMEVSFPNFWKLILIFWQIFQILLIYFNDFLWFLVLETKLWLFDWHWDVSVCAECFGILRYSCRKDPILSFPGFLLFFKSVFSDSINFKDF